MSERNSGPMLDDVMAGRPATKPAPPFGQRLQALRKERGLSQAELADRLGVSRQMVEYYERRALNPSVGFVADAARVLGVPQAALLDDEHTPRKKPGPPSQLEEKLVEARKLPRRKQEILVRMIDAFLEAERRAP